MKNKSIISIISAAVLLVSIGSCHTNHKAAELTQDITAQSPRLKSIDNRFLYMQDEFSYKLFKSTYEEGKNTLVSPLSAAAALAAAANGAQGETLDELLALWENGLSLNELNGYLGTYIKSLSENELKSANSIWIRDIEGFNVNNKFLQTNTDFYGAQIFKSAFDDSIVNEINNWIKDKSGGKIDKMLDKTDEHSMIYLINALFFEANWSKPYQKTDTYADTFISYDGKEQNAQMMSSTEDIYINDGNATGFIKMYEGEKYGFAAILPNKEISVKEYLEKFSPSTLFMTRKAKVKAAMPKFDISFNTDLRNALAKLGVEKAFNPGSADFSQIYDCNQFYISRILHNTGINVDETGTKAGAATVIEDKCYSANDTYETVILNRPFIYMIVDSTSKLPVFIGTVESLNN